MVKSAIVWIFVLATSLMGCGERAKESDQVPTILNYWEAYDFSDTTNFQTPDVGEQAVVDFLDLAQRSEYSNYVEAINNTFDRASKTPTALKYLLDNFERYLYDPNSPMYNEMLYFPVLAFVSKSNLFEEYERARFSERLNLLKRNNPGSKAANFSYQTPDGTKNDLYSQIEIPTLLFFYEPGCGGCADAIDKLHATPEVKSWVERGDVAILAIYATADQKSWEEYQPYIPSYCVNGINLDKSIIGHNLYDLKASPTFYLLDGKKDVVLKDCSLEDAVQLLAESIHAPN
ncbi:DUF5106 domain-containing protein [Sphingobacterium corticis]|uniref:DUF5106 domain-containing protein n=1 Tax=Sphingobacterium corticis TaxID=1812823 RepID=A0ABW5NJY2_9SPHI